MSTNIQENINSIVEEMIQEYLNEGETVPTVEDLFKFLERDPKAYTYAYVYYTYPVKTRQYQPGMGRSKDTRTPEYHDPMFGKLFKSAALPFRWKETYHDAVLRANPDYEFSRTDDYHDVSVFEQGAKGTVFPIVVDPNRKYESAYGVLQEDGSMKVVPVESVSEYLRSGGDRGPVKFRKLLANRVNSVSGGRMKWINPNAETPFFGKEPIQ